MKLHMTPDYLAFYEALASDTRLEIIQLLCVKDRNIKELAEALGISSSIITKHVRKLEAAKIITTNAVTKDGSQQKMCTILNTTYEIEVPFKTNRREAAHKFYTISVPVGQFTDISVTPPCGMASEKHIIGDLDEPKTMLNPARFDAQLLWFGGGYVEYMLPNHVGKRQQMTDLEIMGEFGSETAGYKDDWPSRIKVYLNGTEICAFTTPGDFGETKGSLTPPWWRNNQYGIFVAIKVTRQGVYVNGEKRSSITMDYFDPRCSRWVLRFEAGAVTSYGGGFTIYGEKFGNYPQNLVVREYYRNLEAPNKKRAAKTGRLNQADPKGESPPG